MPAPDLPYSDPSHSTPRLDNDGSASRALYPIIEEDEDQENTQGISLGIYEDIRNYESLEDGDNYDDSFDFGGDQGR